MSDLGAEMARGNVTALDFWRRSCQAAPFLSQKSKPWFIGDLCWPDGSDKTREGDMLCWDGEKWHSLDNPPTYNIQARPMSEMEKPNG